MQASKRKVSWGEIDSNADFLAMKIRDRVGDNCVIMGIANGGIIPAVLLAKRLLDKHPFITIHRSRGVNKWPRHPRWERINEFSWHTSTYILVDDIADKGVTMLEALDSLGVALGKKNVILATLYKRKATCCPLPNHVYAEGIDDDQWLVFPWEVAE